MGGPAVFLKDKKKKKKKHKKVWAKVGGEREGEMDFEMGRHGQPREREREACVCHGVEICGTMRVGP